MHTPFLSRSTIHTIKVFVDTNNSFGSPLGIVEDVHKALSAKERQHIAATLNYSETVFIENPQSGEIRVYNPIDECPFSMYAALGAAWFIKNKLSYSIAHIVSKDKVMDVIPAEEKTWVRSAIAVLPSWNLVEYKTLEDIESLAATDFVDKKHVMAWAWMNKAQGTIRARTFAYDWGIPEDEANGSGSMRLAVQLQRSIKVIHGKGSVIYAKQYDNEHIDVGGNCRI